MMIMQADRQDFDDVTVHMYLIITFIGQTFLCQQKRHKINKFLSTLQIREHYATSRSRLRQGQRLGLAKIKIQDKEQVHVSRNTLNTLG